MTPRRPTPPPVPAVEPGAAPRGLWLSSGRPASAAGVVWLVRPMPDGQWPPEHDLPRDDSFSWWVRSACGHPRGFRQWAFYQEKDARVYESVFRDDPCRFSRCPRQIMIENEQGSKG